jgi:hypothetical protein
MSFLNILLDKNNCVFYININMFNNLTCEIRILKVSYIMAIFFGKRMKLPQTVAQ